MIEMIWEGIPQTGGYSAECLVAHWAELEIEIARDPNEEHVAVIQLWGNKTWTGFSASGRVRVGRSLAMSFLWILRFAELLDMDVKVEVGIKLDAHIWDGGEKMLWLALVRWVKWECWTWCCTKSGSSRTLSSPGRYSDQRRQQMDWVLFSGIAVHHQHSNKNIFCSG